MVSKKKKNQHNFMQNKWDLNKWLEDNKGVSPFSKHLLTINMIRKMKWEFSTIDHNKYIISTIKKK